MAAIFELLQAKSELAGMTRGRTCTSPLNDLREAGEGSSVAVLGYPVTYAIGHVLLSVAGTVFAAVLYAWNN